MSGSAIAQLLSACMGIMGSLFFAIGIVRQTDEAMARLAQTHWDSHPNMPLALGQQKADYLFGGGLIVLAFALQLLSFFVSADPVIPVAIATRVPWIAAGATVVAFCVLRLLSVRLGKRYESRIEAILVAKGAA